MNMEQMQGVRIIIDRLGLPPRMKILVEQIEDRFGPLEEMPDIGAAEVRRIRGYVDGENLLAAIVARIINDVPVEEEALQADAQANDQRGDFERWNEAAEKFSDQLVLLLIAPQPDSQTYVAFDAAADRIADTIKEHAIIIDRHTAVSLATERQADWAQALVDAGLDVLLVEENPDADGGYATTSVLDMGLTAEIDEDEGGEGGAFRPPEGATPTIEQPGQVETSNTTETTA
jgi:hypothetical protein